MFYHQHPYEIFIPPDAEKLIVGTLPPPRFSIGELKEKDVDFCYGSCDGLLWPLLDEIFSLSLLYDNSERAVQQRKEFLSRQRIGICDIVASCKREKMDASDLGMRKIRLRDILTQLHTHPSIKTLLFTGGNSQNGPEYLFRKQLKKHGLQLTPVRDILPRKHVFIFENREVTTFSLISPSNAANRAIGSNRAYKICRQHDPSYSVFQFRLEQYREVFLEQEAGDSGS